ncbi:MAG: GTPase domain-containing protein [Gemmataceae bacterium]
MTPALSLTDRHTPRVVFFGPARSGKSKLVDLFVSRAADGDAAPVPLTPAGPTAPVQRELVPHLLHIPQAAGPVLVCDCDGRVAGELLASPDALVRGAARALADAVRSADALVLVVDAAAGPEVVDQTFRDFGRFLEGLEEGRTFGREVGGLPVLLTLAKCDALHQPGDRPTDWLGRVEAAERRVRDRFEEFFGDEIGHPSGPAGGFLSFGSIDLSVHATAAAVPPGEEFAAYADAGGAFGVDALVGDCLPAARAYRSRAESARRRLRWIVGGAGSLLVAMAVGLATLAGSGGAGGDPLANRVRSYQRREGPPAVRLADRALPATLRELAAIHDTPGFRHLPTELQGFVTDRLREAEAYQVYRSGFAPPRLGPAEVRTREQVDALAEALRGPLAPPAEFAADWADTDASKLRAKWLADLDLLRAAVDRLDDWYRGLIRRANALLLTEKPPDPTWRAEATRLLADADTPPVKPEATVERSPAVPLLRGKPLTYAAAFSFDRVERAKRDWQDTGGRLKALRDLSDALGLTTGPGTPPPVLDLPEPTDDPLSLLSVAQTRLLTLESRYPSDNRAEWELTNFPDPVRGVLANRLAAVSETGTRSVRRLIAAAIGPNADRPAAWSALTDALLREPGVVAWGQLLALLDRWQSAPSAPTNPVTSLAEFVKRDRFDLELKSVAVAIPDDLLDPRPLPAGPLVITHTPAGRPPVEYRFRAEGEARRERPVTVHTFVPDGHPGKIEYRPGDGLTAALPLRSDGADARLAWANSRTPVYQFDALARPPRLEREGPVRTSEPASGVRLTVAPPGGLPMVPAVVPDTTTGGR